MARRIYRPGESIDNQYGLKLRVQVVGGDPDKTDMAYKTTCATCGSIFEGFVYNLEKKQFCSGCTVKSAILNTDADGEIISINGMLNMEYLLYLMATHDLPESEAIKVNIEIFKRQREKVRLLRLEGM